MDTHAFKRSLHHSERYNRRGFGRAEEVAESLEQAYQSGLIGTIRDNGYRLEHGRLNVRLAEAFGFCWGVERAVAMAYETRKHYPSERLWITNEIIHNPSVNDHLREMDVQFIPVEQGVKDFSGVTSGDVVILPAFGATVQEMQLLNERGCHIVDTTCPWVSKVWNTVEKHKKHTFTSIIHGKVKHEEHWPPAHLPAPIWWCSIWRKPSTSPITSSATGTEMTSFNGLPKPALQGSIPIGTSNVWAWPTRPRC